PAKSPQTQAAQGSQSASQPAPAPAPSTQPEPSSATAQPAETVPDKAGKQEQQIVVENEDYRITFTNRGAMATSWVLKKYKDDSGHPLDLVSKEGSKYGLPLSLFTYDENLRNQLNSALYVASTEGTLTAPGELVFEYASKGVTARKSFMFGS